MNIDYSELASLVPNLPEAPQTEPLHYEIIVGVTGVHCTSCISLIENALLEHSYVLSARLNMSTGRLAFRWQGDKSRANDLVAAVEQLGYTISPINQDAPQAQEKDQERFLLKCIAVAGFAAGNVMLISVGLWSTDGQTMGLATRDLFHWVSLLIALPACLYAGRPFFRSAFSVLKNGHTNMDVPISLAIILACAISIVETLRGGEHIYFDSALMLTLFLLIGRFLDARAKGKARRSAQDLLSMLTGTATILVDGQSQNIPIRDLREGMIVRIATGERIPADGHIVKGETQLDTSLITGESIPTTVCPGDALFSGTLNLSAPIDIKLSRASDKSLLSDIVKLMETAEQNDGQFVRLAERAAKIYVPVVHSLALLTFLGWFFWADQSWQASLIAAITVLIITCPCALGLAVPVVQVLASGVLMRRGILLKSGDALERLATIDTAIFDKTGTLTRGEPQLLKPLGDQQTEQLKLAASLASFSKHPLAKALAKAGQDEDMQKALTSVKEHAGKGMEALYQDNTVRLGNASWCQEIGETVQQDKHTNLELWLCQKGKTPLAFTFQDQLRDDSTEVIEQLKGHHITPILLSGDRPNVTKEIAETTKIEEWQGAYSPVDKFNHIDKLKNEGHRILMVGDGLNDAPSLRHADVSISPSTAMDIAQNSADIIFQGTVLQPVYDVWHIAKRATSLIKGNFALAIIYNFIAIPLAVLGYVTPVVAAIAMSASSLIVIGNSFRILKEEKRL